MGRLNKLLKGEGGFTLLELMVSLAIMSIGMLGVVAMFVYAIGGNAEGRNLSRATNLASKKIEELKLTTYANLDSDAAGQFAPAPDDNFKIRYWTVQDIPELNKRKATVSVTWEIKGITHEVKMTSEIAKH